jgi:hypothetical protein
MSQVPYQTGGPVSPDGSVRIDKDTVVYTADEQNALVMCAAIAPGRWPELTDEIYRREALFRRSANERNVSLPGTALAAAARSVAHDLASGWF